MADVPTDLRDCARRYGEQDDVSEVRCRVGVVSGTRHRRRALDEIHQLIRIAR